MGTPVREAELQDAHSRHTEVLAQFVDLGSDEAEIFGDERQITEDLFESLEQRPAWSFHPLAINGSLFFSGNRPVSLETTEVVQTYVVIECQRAADARDPPVEAMFFQQLPL